MHDLETFFEIARFFFQILSDSSWQDGGAEGTMTSGGSIKGEPGA
jgi:hypothetical protein